MTKPLAQHERNARPRPRQTWHTSGLDICALNYIVLYCEVCAFYSQLERGASASQAQPQHTPREVDSDHPVRWYYDPANDAQVQHVTMKYLYEPHTLVGLILLLGMPIVQTSFIPWLSSVNNHDLFASGGLLAFFFFYDSSAHTTVQNVKVGLTALAVSFLLIGLVWSTRCEGYGC
jgi:hypothetical protein